MTVAVSMNPNLGSSMMKYPGAMLPLSLIVTDPFLIFSFGPKPWPSTSTKFSQRTVQPPQGTPSKFKVKLTGPGAACESLSWNCDEGPRLLNYLRAGISPFAMKNVRYYCTPKWARNLEINSFAPVGALVAAVAEGLGLGIPTAAQIGLGRFFDHCAVWRNYCCLAVDF